MEKNITDLTDLILSEQVQGLIAPYRDISVLISVLFIGIGLVLLFQEKFFFADIKRRIFDFLSDAKSFKKPRRFGKEWEHIENLFQKGEFEEMIILIDKLMFEILTRFGYVGADSISIIEFNNIADASFPNKDNVKRVCEFSKLIKEGKIELERQEVVKIFDLSKETLLKLNVLEK